MKIGTHKINTVMREAFLNLTVKPSAFKAESDARSVKTVEVLANAAKSGAGVVNRPDWNASLSFLTFKLLNGPNGYINPLESDERAAPWNLHTGKRNNYDCMCHA